MFILYYVSNPHVCVSTLLDSGSAGNLISLALVNLPCVPVVKLVSPITVNALDGHPISNAHVSFITQPVSLDIHPNHTETIQFHVLPHSQPSLVLGLLRKHNPIIDWQAARVLSRSPSCTTSCSTYSIPLYTTSVESPLAHLPVNIPHEYHSLQVFSATKAACLPPHRLWDCPIKLLPGKTPPQSAVYPLSLVETKAMEDLVAEALGQGFISRSTSPASASFSLCLLPVHLTCCLCLPGPRCKSSVLSGCLEYIEL